MKKEIKERWEMIQQGIVPNGFKKTKAGIIPEDWAIFKLNELTDKIFVGIAQMVTDHLRNSGTVLIRNQNIKTGFMDLSNVIYISKEFDELNASKRVMENDIVLTRTGAKIGSISVIPKKLENSQTFTTLIIRPSYRIYPMYFINHFLSALGQKELVRLVSGEGKPNFNAGCLQKYVICLPFNIDQQTKIANILSTWDKAIEVKEKLIEQKKLQKKGLMQLLLTGKMRVINPDTGKKFEGEWEEVRLGELVEFIKKERVDNPEEYNLLSVKLHLKGVEYTDNKPNKTKNGRPYHFRFENEILIGRQNYHNGGIAVYKTQKQPYIASNAISSLKVIVGNNDYILFKLSNPTYYKRVGHLIGRTGQKEISESVFLKLRITITTDEEEQSQIAKILSNAVKEIELLEKQLEQLKEQRKGLMQLLLTGIVRVQ